MILFWWIFQVITELSSICGVTPRKCCAVIRHVQYINIVVVLTHLPETWKKFYLICSIEYTEFDMMQLQDPSHDILKEGKYLMLAVQELVSGDQCEGRFVFGRESRKPKTTDDIDRFTKDGANPKSLLQTQLLRSGHSPPKYKTKHLKTNEFRALVEFKGMQFVGKPKSNKQLAEGDAAIEALAWLNHTSNNNQDEFGDSQPDVTDNMLKLLGKRHRSKHHSG